MHGKKIGYIRVSTSEQNIERQLEGIELDKVFIDKASGRNTSRPQFQAMLDYVREGDTLYVHSIDRLARSLLDLLQTVKTLNEKHVKITFVSENMLFTGEDDEIQHLMLSQLGAYAEFERKINSRRQKEGIALAKKRGVYKGGTPKLNEEQTKALKKRFLGGATVADLTREFKISRPTVYKYLK